MVDTETLRTAINVNLMLRLNLYLIAKYFDDDEINNMFLQCSQGLHRYEDYKNHQDLIKQEVDRQRQSIAELKGIFKNDPFPH